MTLEQFLTADTATQLTALHNKQFIRERRGADYKITTYQLYDFYLRTWESLAGEDTWWFTCFEMMPDE
ncbi:hypothetical protein [Niabella beijingensis]|uniref:hypothetical protein n=1 Tax=Niabella beijingensis TaxID=2872700 RepID=UPI001CBF1181|nr:hypothetical protein [Niabella beijingensis]MBZ4192616.1 hypothetical protein [Niabella beijingensis]